MQVGGASNVGALMKLIDKGPQVQAQVGVAVLKQAMDAEGASALQLLQSLDPNLGQNINVRV